MAWLVAWPLALAAAVGAAPQCPLGGGACGSDGGAGGPPLRNVCAFGKTGSGKSETGNVLAGKAVFVAGDQLLSVTTAATKGTWERFGARYIYADTPGFFDTGATHEETVAEIEELTHLVPQGCHAILLVVNLNRRFTPEEQQTVDGLMELLGGEGEALGHTILAFTHGERWPISRIRAEVAAGRVPAKLGELVRKSEPRLVHVDISSEAARDQSAERLHEAISGVMAANGGRPYTNQYFAEARARMQDILEAFDPKAKAEREGRERLAREAQEQKADFERRERESRERAEREQAERHAREVRERKEALVWRIHGWDGTSSRIYNIARPDSRQILRELGDGSELGAAGQRCTVENYATGGNGRLVRVDSIWQVSPGVYNAELSVVS